MKLTPVFAIAAALLLNACAPITRVILLPQADGSASSVVVKTSKGEQILNTPYQRASGQEDAPVKLDATTSLEVQKTYPALFAAKPPAPTKYILNFMPGGTELTPESKAALPKILGDTNQRKGADLVVTGHTDTTGALLANDELSLKRAEVVTKLLVGSGAPAARIESVGRGKRELLIKTEDNVDEPQNRRVEILVR
ncbi:MAG: OmpA family protein [Polaromonas sp.]|nr:OmpA family protein [Polaromonas sp.]